LGFEPRDDERRLRSRQAASLGSNKKEPHGPPVLPYSLWNLGKAGHRRAEPWRRPAGRRWVRAGPNEVG